MIIFPLEDWNTFTDVDTVTAKITELGQGDLWSALTLNQQETYLHKSTLVINSVCYVHVGSKCPFVDGQVMLIMSDLVNDGRFLNFLDKEQKYTKARISKLNVEYIIKDSMELPQMFKSMMNTCLKRSNGMRGFRIA